MYFVAHITFINAKQGKQTKQKNGFRALPALNINMFKKPIYFIFQREMFWSINQEV